MTTLPVLGVSCTSADLSMRLGGLSSWSEQLGRGRTRRLWGGLLAGGSLVGGLVCMLLFESRPFTDASLGLFVLGGFWSAFHVTAGRLNPRRRRNVLLITAVVILLLMLFDVVPTPLELLAALDLRTFPVEASTAALLSVLGVTGSLLWDSTGALPGALESGLVEFVGQLVHPLLADAAIEARGFLRVSPFAPSARHWQLRAQGNIHERMLERLVCELTVPLEQGERVVLQVSEVVVTRTWRGLSPRGKFKVKDKGYQRSIEARLRWTLDRPAPNTADLTPQLQAHLRQLGILPNDVQASARGARDAIEVRLRQQTRHKIGTYRGLDHDWIDARLVHESGRFLATMRAALLGRP